MRMQGTRKTGIGGAGEERREAQARGIDADGLDPNDYPMPNLSVVQFSASSTNNGPAGLVPSERMQLVDANGAPLATPSAPRNDAFHDCTYSATCT